MFENKSMHLVFGHKNVVVVFNEDPKAKVHAVTEPWKSKSIANALTAAMVGYYPVQEDGLYLKMSFEEAQMGLGEKNLGYVTSKKLVEMVAEGRIVRNKEIEPNAKYRIAFDGFRFTSAMLPYREYVEDEPEFVRHDRNARLLIENLEWLKKAESLHLNVRLLYTENEEAFFTEKEAQYQLYMLDQMDELKEHVNAGNLKAQTYQTMKHFVALNEKAVAKNTPFVIPSEFVVKNTDDETIEPSDLVGTVIQFVRGQIVVETMYSVTEENLGSIVATLKRGGFKVFVAKEANVEA